MISKHILDKAKTYFSLCIISLVLIACDDEITVDTGSSTPILNIDAWVNDKSGEQYIYLTTTQDYFDDELPPVVSGAEVTITDSEQNTFTFTEDTDSDEGAYVWVPDSTTSNLVVEGRTYTLSVIVDGEEFTSTSTAGRVPQVDSISIYLEVKEGRMKDEYIAEFWAVDPVGTGDTYWIKTYKNGTLLTKPSELNIAYDASKNSGGLDGVTFISNVREGINANETDDDGFRASPLTFLDSIYVEINSLTEASFSYMSEVITQTNKDGGISELLTATALANVSCNIYSTAENGSEIVGFFNVSTTSGLGKKFRTVSDLSP
ncbi:DUF4249 family protein [Chondrinema litorale]|uniref:DUF4249 family protein n=1 Tax=Chondrinema litorale TaxID=2994555 RepID=UPI002542CC22|nr:DUF4249 family protein [Chondrinema litorale]UZR97231.1 DUF4249 family protein [Chondrinema litorale]